MCKFISRQVFSA